MQKIFMLGMISFFNLAHANGPSVFDCTFTLYAPEASTIIHREKKSFKFMRDDGQQWVAFLNQNYGTYSIQGGAAFSELGGGEPRKDGSVTMVVRQNLHQKTLLHIESILVGKKITQSYKLQKIELFRGKYFGEVSITCMAIRE